MTTLTDRPNRALLVIDVQNGVVEGGHDLDAVVTSIKALVDQARAAGMPVIWVQHHDDELERGSAAWQWVEGLGPAAGEPLVEKSYGDSFADTELEQLLADRGVGDVVLVGAQSEQCVRSTLHGAVVRGYDAAVVRGAHTTQDLTEYGMPEPSVVVGFVDMIAQYGMQWPGRRGRLIDPEELTA